MSIRLTKIRRLTTIRNLKNYITGKFIPLPSKRDYGLCDNVICEGWHASTYFETWKHFSGCPIFPVEGCQKAYDNSSNRRNDRRTKFGKLRLDLAKHLLKELKKEAADEKICTDSWENC